MKTPELKQQLSGKLRPQYLFFVLAPALRSYLLCCAVPLFLQPALWESGIVDTDIYLDFYLGIKLLQSPDTLLQDAFFLSKILMMAFVCFFLLCFFTCFSFIFCWLHLDILLIGVSIMQEWDALEFHLPVQLCIRTRFSTLYSALMELHQLSFYLWTVSPWIYLAFIVRSYVCYVT